MIANSFITPFEFTLGFKIIFPSLQSGIDIQMVGSINEFTAHIFKSLLANKKCHLSHNWNNKWDEDIFVLRIKGCVSCLDYVDVEDYPSKGKGRRKNTCKECDNQARRAKYVSKEKNELEIVLEFSNEELDKAMIVNTVYDLIKPRLAFKNQHDDEIDVEALIRPKENVLLQ